MDEAIQESMIDKERSKQSTTIMAGISTLTSNVGATIASYFCNT